jgi:DNA-binding NarL/FixJ family response regulator
MYKSDLDRSRSSIGETSDRIRVVVVDDHPAIREALFELIRTKIDMVFCGHASSASSAFERIREGKPTVAVVDISLEDAHGLDLVQNLRAQYPALQVVIFSMYDETIYAERALRAGALGYVMKSEPTQSVADAIRSVADGEIYLSRRMASRLLSKLAMGSAVSSPGFALDELTDREMEVFQMLGQGQSVEEIARRLKLSRKTVETYRRRSEATRELDKPKYHP